jgi:hypothetical protein
MAQMTLRLAIEPRWIFARMLQSERWPLLLSGWFCLRAMPTNWLFRCRAEPVAE